LNVKYAFVFFCYQKFFLSLLSFFFVFVFLITNRQILFIGTTVIGSWNKKKSERGENNSEKLKQRNPYVNSFFSITGLQILFYLASIHIQDIEI